MNAKHSSRGLPAAANAPPKKNSSTRASQKLHQLRGPEHRPPDMAAEVKQQTTGSVVRVPLTTRIRSDFALALKRASLQRQLSGVSPNTLQDILEEALEPWLRSNGYLS